MVSVICFGDRFHGNALAGQAREVLCRTDAGYFVGSITFIYTSSADCGT